MQKIIKWMLIVAVFISALPALAQTPYPIIIRDGDLWTWRNAGAQPVQLTQWAYNSDLTISPNGAWVAYNSIPLSVIQQLEAGTAAYWMMEAPSNIWIMRTANEDFERIALQPNNDVVTTENAILRSPTVWSPDSTRVAWLEFSTNPNLPYEQANRIMVYDTRNGLTTTLVTGLNLGFQDGGFIMPELHWVQSGIQLPVISYLAEGGNQLHYVVQQIDPNIGTIQQFAYPINGTGIPTVNDG